MRKSVLVLLIVLLPFAMFAEGQQESAGYADGIYFAQEDNFSEKSGWKYVVTLEVKGGEIVDVEWTGAHKTGGTDKKTRSADGEYNMVAYGGAQAEWHEQAALVEEAFLESQGEAVDAVAGVSITIDPIFTLAEKALAAGPVGYGMWKDGAYHAEQAEFSHNYKYFADFTVISGYIVAAYWDAVAEDGTVNKREASESGAYGMVAKGGAQAEWHEQAALTEASLIANQDPKAISFDEEGATDEIAGVSIGAGEFYELAAEALVKR